MNNSLQYKRVSLPGMIMAMGVVACFATVFGFFGKFSWFLDLFSHFRVQYFFALAICGGFFLFIRDKKNSIIFFLFAALNFYLFLPFYTGRENFCHGRGCSIFRAMLLNVNTKLGDPKLVKKVIQEINPDILVLEEINCKWLTELAWLTDSYPYSVIEPREDNFGIVLFSKLSLSESKIEYIGSAEVPSIIATLQTEAGEIGIIGTHPLPPAGPGYSHWRNEQLELLPHYVSSSIPFILLGDFNVTPWSYHFKKLLRNSGLKDSSIGFGIQTSWPSNLPFLRIPLDHFLYSPHLVIINRETGPFAGSDHYPVIVDFAVNQRNFG